MIHERVPDSATVYTPRELAAAMVAAARARPRALWLDPCVGDGAFIAEMARSGVASDQILAVDIALRAGASDAFASTTRGVDFLEWARQHHAHVDHVVMNPPYVALSRLRGKALERALDVALYDRQPLPFKANYWCAFVVRALDCVRPNGSMVVVLPAAWDFAKYAVRVRETVEQGFGEIVVVRCASPMFPTVKEGAVVVAAFQRGAQPCTVRRVEVPDLVGAIAALRQVGEGRAPRGAAVLRGVSTRSDAHTRLGELIDIHIGAVTGDAHYFLLTEDERVARGLPRSAVTPVLSRSKHLASAVIGKREWAALRNEGGRVWLFRPSKDSLRHRAVKRYLRHGRQGGCELGAYKVSSRTPWHRTPLPGRVDGFLSGMSRRLPFLALRKMRGLTATNTLYVVRFRKRTTAAERATLGIILLSSAVREDLVDQARVYADGLLKFEPGELGAIRVPVVQPRSDAIATLRRATALLLKGQEEAASAVADAWLVAAQLGRPRPAALPNVRLA